MNVKNWITGIISQPKRIAIPIMTHPGIEMIGKRVIDAVQDGEIHARAIKVLNDTYPAAATTVIMDLTVEAEAFGARIEFPENDMPHILGRLVSDAEDIEKLVVPDLSTGRIPEYLKANRLSVEAIRDKPVFGGMIGPFSLAGRLYDMSEIMIACYMEPDAIAMLLEKCTAFLLQYCMELKRTGCAGVVIAEPAAGLLSNEDCMTFSSKYLKEIITAVQDDQFLVTLHNCGNTGHCTDAMLYTEAGAYHFGNAIDMVGALKACPADVLVMGNIDPVGVMKMMAPDEVRRQVGDLLERTKNFKNYVLSTGCDIPPHVSLDNIKAFYEALNRFNEKHR